MRPNASTAARPAVIRTAVIPAAGFGTRMLPATRAVPKELLPVGTQPAIQWAVDEAVAAGIERCVIVSSLRKPSIEAYFEEQDPHDCAIEIVNQPTAAGLGDAIQTARGAFGNDPVAVLLPDEVLLGGARLLRAMLDDFTRTGCSNVSVMPVAREEIGAYGCADLTPRPGADLSYDIVACVEKPTLDDAPSSFALSGRYVLGPDVLDALGRVRRDPRGEVQLTDALDAVARTRGLVGIEVLPSDGRVDVGNWDGWLEANNRLLRHGSIARDHDARREWIAISG
jgi:UTP--glucose-1-phosphate uridylyltransferase